jgi:hypothetical protein
MVSCWWWRGGSEKSVDRDTAPLTKANHSAILQKLTWGINPICAARPGGFQRALKINRKKASLPRYVGWLWRGVFPAGRVTPHGFGHPVAQQYAGKSNNQTTNKIMKKIILSCVAVAALLAITGCASDKTHSSTTTTQQTTVPAPVTTTTTDTTTQ